MSSDYLKMSSDSKFIPISVNLAEFVSREMPKLAEKITEKEVEILKRYLLIKNYFEMFPVENRDKVIAETVDEEPKDYEFEAGLAVLKPDGVICRIQHSWDIKKIAKSNMKARLGAIGGKYLHLLPNGTSIQVESIKDEQEITEYSKDEKIKELEQKILALERLYLLNDLKKE